MKFHLLFALIVIFAFTQMAYGDLHQWACNAQREQECKNRCHQDGAYCIEVPGGGVDDWDCKCEQQIEDLD